MSAPYALVHQGPNVELKPVRLGDLITDMQTDLGEVFDATASHRTGSTSFAAIGATLVPTLITGIAFVTAFLLLRRPYRNIYMPRTYFKTIPEHDRTPSSSHSSVPWYHDFRMLNDSFLLRHSSIDAYLFVRFLRVIMIICVLGCFLTWPVLFVVNATGGGRSSQLDKIAFGNVDDNKRLYAHAAVAWNFFGLVILLITRERLFVISLRLAHATLRQNAERLSSRVVLFLSVPSKALHARNLEQSFGANVVRSWPVPKLSDLEGLVDKRSSKIEKLEEVELQLEQNLAKSSTGRSDSQQDSGQPEQLQDSRPTKKSYYLFGEQIDMLSTLRREIPELENKIKTLREQREHDLTADSNAIFVEYEDQTSAQQALKTVKHDKLLAMQPRFAGVQPKEVLWSNLNMDPSLRISYHYLATALVIATIILWSIPVGIVGTISNISYLTDKVRWLRFIDNLPDPILGFLTGFIPPYVLSELVSYVPNLFRHIAKLSGQPTTVEAEKLTQNWYFAFQVIQVFLVTTFSSGAATVVTKIANEPASVPVLLARNLPKAANFYLTYYIIQGLGSATKNVVNYSDLFSYIFYYRFFDRTPRQKYVRRTQMKGIGWGKAYPKFTNFAVIALAYSCIAPLVLGFAAIGTYLFYIAYRYQFLYVIQVKLEPRGASYSLAMQHLMTGVYLAELCLLGLFSIRQAAGPSALLVILFVSTVIYHIAANRYLSPLEKALPIDLISSDDDREPLLTAEDGGHAHSGRIQRMRQYGLAAIDKLPSRLLDPFRLFLEPRFLPSVDDLRSWLVNPASGDEPPTYSEEDIQNAYKSPAFVSKMPTVWIPRDQNGVSAMEIETNNAADIPTTDEGATVDKAGNLSWAEDDFEAAPIFKSAKKY